MERGLRQKLTPFARALVSTSVLFQIALYTFIFFLYEEKKEYNEAVNFKASLEVDLINV